MQGKKYAVALSQIAECPKQSNNGMALAQMSVKLMSPGVHRKADIVGMIMVGAALEKSLRKIYFQNHFFLSGSSATIVASYFCTPLAASMT